MTEPVAKITPVVIVAEDETAVRNLVAVVLQRAGFTALAAADGLEALQLSRSFQGRIDLLLTDLAMPRMDGNELAKWIALERPETKIVLMSGYATAAIDLETPCHSFLAKPFTPDVLSNIINRGLKRAAFLK